MKIVIVFATLAITTISILALPPSLIDWKSLSIVRSYRISIVSHSINELTGRYWRNEPLRKVFVNSDETDRLASLRASNNVVKEVDYDSFKLLIISEMANDFTSLTDESTPMIPNNEDIITLNELVIDTTKPQEQPDNITYSLRQTNMTDAILWNSKPQGGLFLLQFIGPAKTAWLDEIRKANVNIVDYIGNCSYVVSADADSAERLVQLFRERDYLQFLGDYEPALRIRPSLRQMIRQTENALSMLPRDEALYAAESTVAVIVQVIDGEFSEATISQISALALEPPDINHVVNYHNISATIRTIHLSKIASMDTVFSIEENPMIVRQDELQAQIVTQNFAGAAQNQYRGWLQSKRFLPNTQPVTVNIVDDCQILPEKSNFSNITFQRNLGASGYLHQSGHGYIVAQIVGGNSSDGYSLNGRLSGVGISPYSSIGVTRVFNQSDELYTRNFIEFDTDTSDRTKPLARISNNSWGNVINSYKTRYDTLAQAYDQLAFVLGKRPSPENTLAYVFSAGNFADADQDGISEGSTITSPAIAKNVITVGASETNRFNDRTSICGAIGDSDNTEDVAFFSGRGRSRSIDPKNNQCVNGEVREIVRVKPDLVAPATRVMGQVPPEINYLENLFGCERFYPEGQKKYTWISGTSFAAPVVSGAAALLLQKYNKFSPALIKAWLMNSATGLSGSNTRDRCTGRPDLASSTQGMGRIDLQRSFDDIPRYVNDQKTILTRVGETYTVTGNVNSAGAPLRVTLVWTDPPAALNTENYLKNDLDLEIIVNKKTYIGNLFNGSSSIDATGKSIRDRQNNVESIYLTGLAVGTPFTITIRAVNLNGDGVTNISSLKRQDFALVVYNANRVNASGMIIPSSYMPTPRRAIAMHKLRKFSGKTAISDHKMTN